MGKNRRKRRRNKKDQQIFGYPLGLIEKQPLVKAGDEFTCQRCGQTHRLADGSHEFPEAQMGEVLLYQCGTRFFVGGVKSHAVYDLEDKLSVNYRSAMCLLDMFHALMPIAVMATQQEKMLKEHLIFLKGDEYIPIRLPFIVARQIRFAVEKAYKILQSLNYVNVDQRAEEIMFDTDAHSGLAMPGIPSLMRPGEKGTVIDLMKVVNKA